MSISIEIQGSGRIVEVIESATTVNAPGLTSDGGRIRGSRVLRTRDGSAVTPLEDGTFKIIQTGEVGWRID